MAAQTCQAIVSESDSHFTDEETEALHGQKPCPSHTVAHSFIQHTREGLVLTRGLGPSGFKSHPHGVGITVTGRDTETRAKTTGEVLSSR